MIEIVVSYGITAGLLYLGYKAYSAVRVHQAKRYDPVLLKLEAEATEVRTKLLAAYRNGSLEEELLPYCQELIRISVRSGLRAFYLEECA